MSLKNGVNGDRHRFFVSHLSWNFPGIPARVGFAVLQAKREIPERSIFDIKHCKLFYIIRKELSYLWAYEQSNTKHYVEHIKFQSLSCFLIASNSGRSLYINLMFV